MLIALVCAKVEIVHVRTGHARPIITKRQILSASMFKLINVGGHNASYENLQGTVVASSFVHEI